MDFIIHNSYLFPLLPLIGSAIAGFAGAKLLKGQSHWPIWISVGITGVLAQVLLLGMLFSEGKPAHVLEAKPHGEHTTETVPGTTTAPGEHSIKLDRTGGELTTSATGTLAAESGEPKTQKSYSNIWFNWILAGDSTKDTTANPGQPAGEKPGLNGFFAIKAGAFIDPLTCVMLAVVNGIGFLITVFAAGYMKGEEGYWRFFSYLGLFIFSMNCLVMGENLVMLYLGWEGVGLCSYLLIGYYYQKPAARDAARKAFIVNRIGDFGFALGIMLCFLAFGTVSYFGDPNVAGDGLLERAASVVTAPIAHGGAHGTFQQIALAWAPFLLMLGAFGKSAQFPLYVWLPDAMEGPTPVSALIHAATMVTAGVYMIARCGTLFVTNEAAMITVAAVGAFTALFAGSIALRQFDLKKVFAYSTVSQLGFMFVAVGCLAPVAGVFHLVTHAFFKALLFLSSGVVMHAMLGHLDMRKMSGLKTQLPMTRWLILIGCLALAGFPLTSGFFSKDEIVAAAMGKSTLLGLVMLATAFLTAYYTFRLYFRVFEGPTVVPTEPAEGHHGAHDDHADDAHGAHDAHAGHGAHASTHAVASSSAVHAGDPHESGVDKAAAHNTAGVGHGHGDHGHHNHEPLLMIAPLAVLAVGAIVAGFFNFPFHTLGHFLGQSPSFIAASNMAVTAYGGEVDTGMLGTGAGHIHFSVMLISAVVAVAGIGLAYLLHLKDRAKADQLAGSLSLFANAIENKYWVDELYNAVVVVPLRVIGHVFFFVDRFIVDGLVWLVGFVPQLSGFALRMTTQRGYLQGYALTMLLGVAAILLFVFL
jgi:NADH-quinone oxidoreductase subunit L